MAFLLVDRVSASPTDGPCGEGNDIKRRGAPSTLALPVPSPEDAGPSAQLRPHSRTVRSRIPLAAR